MVGSGPMNSNLVNSCQQPAADLDGGYGEALARADVVWPNPFDGRGGVCEDGVSVAALLPSAHDAEWLVDGVRLRIKDLLVGAEVEAASVLPTGGPPGAHRSYPTVIESGAVRPDGVSSSP